MAQLKRYAYWSNSNFKIMYDVRVTKQGWDDKWNPWIVSKFLFSKGRMASVKIVVCVVSLNVSHIYVFIITYNYGPGRKCTRNGRTIRQECRNFSFGRINYTFPFSKGVGQVLAHFKNT